MHKLRRYYNQNKKAIWRVIGIIVFLFAVLQILNYLAKRENNVGNIITNSENVETGYNELILESQQSALTNNEITSSQEKLLNIIDQFFEYCNNQDIERAYELLTDECKEEMYPNINDFKANYVQKVFNDEKKNITIENWISNIFKVNINDDFLSTGKYTQENNIQDYITVIDNDSEYKLNINSYIGRNEINKTNEKNYVEINVLKKDTYMNYETYTFSIENQTENQILLNNLEDINSIYIEDENGIKYSAYTHELSVAQLLIDAGASKNITIKFFNRYGSEKNIKNIVFSNIILDFESYSYWQDKSRYDNYVEIKIDL